MQELVSGDEVGEIRLDGEMKIHRLRIPHFSMHVRAVDARPAVAAHADAMRKRTPAERRHPESNTALRATTEDERTVVVSADATE